MKNTKQTENTRRDPLETAAAEWRTAQERFQNAVSEQLIDMAIFDMEAAKRRYMFLLKNSKDKKYVSAHMYQ